MTQKGKRGKPTRKEISNAISFLGQKLKYLEEYCVANENMFALYLDFSGKREDFLEFVKNTIAKNEDKKEKKVENKEETK